MRLTAKEELVEVSCYCGSVWYYVFPGDVVSLCLHRLKKSLWAFGEADLKNRGYAFVGTIKVQRPIKSGGSCATNS